MGAQFYSVGEDMNDKVGDGNRYWIGGKVVQLSMEFLFRSQYDCDH